MPLKKFIADSKMFEYDRHYRECHQNNQPFIKARINPVNGNYYVQIDLITCNYNLSIDGKNNMTQLFENEIEFLKSHTDFKSSFKGYNVDKELSWFDGILSTRLNVFCENLYDVAEKHHK